MKKGKLWERGRVETFNLERPFVLNDNIIAVAIVEIDHINYGLNKVTRKLNTVRRTHFSLSDIEKFLVRLDGEYILPRSYKGRVSRFETQMTCPVSGQFSGREFIMVFDLNYDEPNKIFAITLYPGW